MITPQTAKTEPIAVARPRAPLRLPIVAAFIASLIAIFVALSFVGRLDQLGAVALALVVGAVIAVVFHN